MIEIRLSPGLPSPDIRLTRGQAGTRDIWLFPGMVGAGIGLRRHGPFPIAAVALVSGPLGGFRSFASWWFGPDGLLGALAPGLAGSRIFRRVSFTPRIFRRKM